MHEFNALWVWILTHCFKVLCSDVDGFFHFWLFLSPVEDKAASPKGN